MPQETLVVQLSPADQKRLEERMALGRFEYRALDHARFHARGEGVVATLYRSGKLVVQGEAVALFAERYLDGVRAPVDAVPIAVEGRTVVGSDEAGKGDYFGPLVVVALRADPKERAEIARAGVADSKTLSDERVLRLAPALQQRYRHAAYALDPPDYNREHALAKSLNPLLAAMHARVIREVARPGDLVLVDRFADERLVGDLLRGQPFELHQFTRAEREPAVAAASVIARGIFLERLKALSEDCAVDLHKGAGAPTDAAGRAFLELHGKSALGRVAKLHFKNTAKIGGQARG